MGYDLQEEGVGRMWPDPLIIPMGRVGNRYGKFSSNARYLFIEFYCFFIIFFAGFFAPIFMDIIFFIFLNCSSVKFVRISFMAFNISK